MNFSEVDTRAFRVCFVSEGRGRVRFDLEDGRAISVPLEWFPRLQEAAPRERKNWIITGAGYGVHWPDINEDISAGNLLLGQQSRESQRSFQAWRESRAKRNKNQ